MIMYNMINSQYIIQPRERKRIKGHGFLSFVIPFGNKYGKNLMDTTRKAV